MPVSSVTEHWIKQDALTINLNHFGDPDYLQVSVLAGAVVMAFKQDVIGYNAAHNYRTWPIEAANTYLETSSAYNVYARLTRSEVNARALIVYDTVLRDIEGREISYAEDGTEILGDASVDYFFVFLGQISSNIDSNGQIIQREWIVVPNFGNLDTNQQKNDTVGLFDLMFKPHYDNPLNPNEITWIEALTHLGVAGGITMYANGGKLNIPSIYDGLPIDWKTLIRDENGVLKLNPDIELGGGVSNFWDLSGIPSWITNSKPKYTYSEIEGTPDLTQYATELWVNTKLGGYLPLNGNASSATKLQTARTIWGQSFDGVGNVNGNMIGVGIVNSFLNIIQDNSSVSHLFLTNPTSNVDYGHIYVSNYDNSRKDRPLVFQNGYGNVGIGTISPAYKLDVNGAISTSTELIVNGGKIKYDSTNKYWKLEGDLLVTGGVTMYGSDSSFTPSTIMDAIRYDDTTLGINSNGQLYVKGGAGGGINTTDLQNYLTQNSYLNVTSGDNRYLKLSGGVVKGVTTINGNTKTSAPLEIETPGMGFSGYIKFANGGTTCGYLGVGGIDKPVFRSSAAINYTLWHSGNDGADSGLDADLLDGKQPSDLNVGSATKLQTARTIWGQSFDGTGNVSGDMTGVGTMSLSGDLTSGSYGSNCVAKFQGIGSGTGYYSVVELITNNEVSISYSNNSRYSDSKRWSVGRASSNSNYRFNFWNASYNGAVSYIDLSGNFWVAGGITMYSDQRKKTILNHVELSLKQIANAPLIEHYYNNDDAKTTHVGSIAQYWASMNDWFCKLDSEGFYTMEIQNAALASAISVARELERYESKTDKDIKKLKKRICKLEEEVERLKSA